MNPTHSNDFSDDDGNFEINDDLFDGVFPQVDEVYGHIQTAW